MAQLGVQIVGSAVGYKAALGESLAATQRWASQTAGETVKVTESFRGVSTAALQSAAAADKLAIAYGRYGEGTLGAAAATVRYRQQIEALRASSLESFRAVGRSLTTYVSLPMAAIGYEAVKAATTFQQEMLKIQTQAGASAGEVKNLSGQVLNLADITPQGPVELAQGLYHLESLGLRGAKAMMALKEAAIAAGASGANLEDVSTALGAAVVTGLKGTENYHDAMAGLIAITGEGNMRMQDLADALGTGLLPKAENVGLSLNQVGAALATLVDRGMNARRAATQLGTTFALMRDPSAAAQKALADMGIGATTLGNELAKPNGLLRVLETLREGMDRVGKGRGETDILSAFGRSRQSGAILTLVQSLDASVSSYQQKLVAYDRGVQQATERMATYQQSSAYKLHNALAILEADLIRGGKGIGPGLANDAQAFAKAIDEITKAFEALPGPVKDILGIVATGFAVAGPVALGIVGVTKLLAAMRTVFASLPLVARGALAETGAEVAGVETAAATANAEVLALRASLLGLGSIVIPAIVIPIVEKYFGKQLNSPANPAFRVGAYMAGPSHGAAVSGIDSTGALAYAQQLILQGKTDDQIMAALYQRFPRQFTTNGLPDKALLEDEVTAARHARSGTTGGGQHGAAAINVSGGRGIQTPAGTKPAGAGTSVHPLSQAQQLAVALAANPDDKQLIEQKIAADNQAVAWLQRRRAAGKISNADYVKQVDGLYSDRQSMETQLQSLDKKAATAAKNAAEFTLPLALQIAQAAAALTTGTGDDTRVNAAVAAYIRARLPHLHGQARLTALQDLKGVLPAAAGFQVPLPLQLAVAKASTTQSDADDVKAAQAIKDYDEKLLASHKESIQSQIDIYNNIAQQNQVLGQQAVQGAYKAASLASLTQGITDRRTRLAVEARIAQAQAHSGHVPAGAGATYVTVTGPIHVHGVDNPQDLVDKLTQHGRRGTASRRGANAGVYAGRH